jgi:hypothetical protein
MNRPYVRYAPTAAAKQHRAAIPALFALLGTLPAGFVGDFKVSLGELSSVVRSIRVSRGNFPPGPHFQVEAVSAIGNPVVERLAGKFSKSYTTRHPVELLAFHELHPAAPEAMWGEAVQRFVADRLSSSPFCRVWIFDTLGDRILFRSDASL